MLRLTSFGGPVNPPKMAVHQGPPIHHGWASARALSPRVSQGEEGGSKAKPPPQVARTGIHQKSSGLDPLRPFDIPRPMFATSGRGITKDPPARITIVVYDILSIATI